MHSAIDHKNDSGFAFLCSEEPAGTVGTAGKRLKVIVVDDEPAIADSLADILNGEGFDAVAAFSGQVAVDLARSAHPDVVISDVAMPGINGIETVKRIREFLPKCRFVLFSGHAATTGLLDNARAQGEKFDLLPKPVQPRALLDLLRRAAPKQ